MSNRTLRLTEQETKAVVLALRTMLDESAEPDKWTRAALRVLAKIGVNP